MAQTNKPWFLKKKLLLKTNLKNQVFQPRLYVIKRFECNERNNDQQDDSVIPAYLFEEPKSKIAVEFLFWKLNEKKGLPLEKARLFYEWWLRLKCSVKN